VRQVDFAAADARQANDLIDRRTFSWTDLFNRFEMTLPDEVRIASVRPRVDPDVGIVLAINVMARNVDDVGEFIANLEATGAFTNIRPAGSTPMPRPGAGVQPQPVCCRPSEAGRPSRRSETLMPLWKRILIEKRADQLPLGDRSNAAA
jgi:hypothetical protein